MSQHIQAAIDKLDQLLATPSTAGSNAAQNNTSEQSSKAEKSKKGAAAAAAMTHGLMLSCTERLPGYKSESKSVNNLQVVSKKVWLKLRPNQHLHRGVLL